MKQKFQVWRAVNAPHDEWYVQLIVRGKLEDAQKFCEKVNEILDRDNGIEIKSITPFD